MTLPKIGGWPYVGVIPELATAQPSFWLDARAKYGDLFRINLGATEVIALCQPRHAQHVLVDNADNYRSKGGNQGFRAAIRELTNEGLSTADSESEIWRRQRATVQPHFSNSKIRSLSELLREVIAEHLGEWDSAKCSGGAIDVGLILSRIAIDASVRSMFGVRISNEEADKLAANSEVVMDHIWLSIIGSGFPQWLPLFGQDRQQQAIKAVVAITTRLMKRHMEDGGSDTNLLGILLSQLDDDGVEYMTDEFLRDEVVSLLLGGYEIMAVTSRCMLDLLVHNPAALAHTRAEVDQMLGDRLPTYEDLEHLRYCRMVIQETLRLCSPVYQIQRMATTDDEIDGVPIPAGTIVSIITHAIHHHPEHWERPECFEPERFAETDTRHRFAWMPFGGGRRTCVAMGYSLIQGQLILAQALQRFDMTPVLERSVPLYMGTVSRPKSSLRLRIAKRPKRTNMSQQRQGGVMNTLEPQSREVL